MSRFFAHFRFAMFLEPAHIAMIIVTAIAAFTDTRTGLIPNWLTSPTIVLGPVYALLSPSHDPLASALAVVVVGLVPFAMYWMQALGGGDVKLFAGVGGLAGITLGLEVLLYSLGVAMVLAIVTMARQGHLQEVLRNVWRIISNSFLPKSRRKSLVKNEMHQLRLGLSIFLGTCLAVGYQYAGA
ncbi:MAG: prepilin peptidase [Myxococcales bacterium]|nr:prepilin peptidase [Myxococcales bacterium]